MPPAETSARPSSIKGSRWPCECYSDRYVAFEQPEALKRLTRASYCFKDKVPPNDDQSCLIKGNIDGKGERVYHMRDQQHYNRTKIDASKGERWFCTEEEATAAGWRKALR